MRIRFLSVSAALLSSAVPALSQLTVPPLRAHHSLVYDEANKRVMLWGGSTPLEGPRSFAFFNDFWGFDGSRWQAISESGEKRSGVRLAYDSERSRNGCFGGYNGMALR